MPGKRSRVTQSLSFRDIGVLDRRPSPELRWDAAFSSNLTDHPWQSTLTTSSAPLVDENEKGGHAQLEYFLERCFRCKKRLNPKYDIYMYGYLRAFCSPECRDAQIAIDEAVRKVDGESTGASPSNSKC